MNNVPQVCKQFSFEDDHINEKALWVAVLSNGETIYQDDYRPGLSEWSAWKRLKAYCKENQLYIVKLSCRRRNNLVECLPENATGYFFRCCAGADWSTRVTEEFLILGWVSEDKSRILTWQVDGLQLLLVLPGSRPVTPENEGSIIWRNNEVKNVDSLANMEASILPGLSI